MEESHTEEQRMTTFARMTNLVRASQPVPPSDDATNCSVEHGTMSPRLRPVAKPDLVMAAAFGPIRHHPGRDTLHLHRTCAMHYRSKGPAIQTTGPNERSGKRISRKDLLVSRSSACDTAVYGLHAASLPHCECCFYTSTGTLLEG